MKTLTKNNLSLYIFEDGENVTIENNRVVTDGLIIGDLNAGNAVLHEGVTAPDNWKGSRYFFDGTDWTLNIASAPKSVPAANARKVLLRRGITNDMILAQLNAIADDMEREEALIDYEYQTEFVLGSELVNSIGAALGLDESGIAELFIEADV